MTAAGAVFEALVQVPVSERPADTYLATFQGGVNGDVIGFAIALKTRGCRSPSAMRSVAMRPRHARPTWYRIRCSMLCGGVTYHSGQLSRLSSNLEQEIQ